MPPGVYIRTAETIAKLSAVQKKRYEDPAERLKMSVAGKRYYANPVARERASSVMKESHKRPEVLAKMSVAKTGVPLSKEHIAALKEAQNRPEVKAKNSAASKGKSYEERYGPEKAAEMLVKKSDAQKKLWQDEEYRASMTGEGNPNWQGGVGKLPYSFEWTEELRESVRKRDGRICQLCDKTEEENGQRLDVHHIDGDINNCDPDNLISLCRGCHGKIKGNREYYQVIFEEKVKKCQLERL